MSNYDIIIVGGGPAGLAAAQAAWDGGAKSILILERDATLGGILNQCIHNGFGLHRFKEELTGPEYAARYISLIQQTGVEVKSDTMVLDIAKDKTVHAVNTVDGYLTLHAKAVVLAMGCRERTRGAISIPGSRPAGVFTAGTAQRYLNMEGYLVGKRVVILGSGDIGLIMARRMTLEGAKVLACVELMPYSGGLTRNIVQCLQDFDIPLYLSHTVTNIEGEGRVKRIHVMEVDANRAPIAGTEMVFDCDTLLLSVGLVPENELTKNAGIRLHPRTNGAVVYENMETEAEGIFACGNVVHVHDLVDFVSAESARAGAAAAQYVLHGEASGENTIQLNAVDGVTYTVPMAIRPQNVEKAAEVMFRVGRVYGACSIEVKNGDEVLASFKRDRAAPGEMEKIVLPRTLLEKAGSSLTIGIREA